MSGRLCEAGGIRCELELESEMEMEGCGLWARVKQLRNELPGSCKMDGFDMLIS